MGLRKPKLNVGKKFASGTAITVGTKVFYYMSGVSAISGSFNYIEVTGLTFRPSSIVFYDEASTYQSTAYRRNGFYKVGSYTTIASILGSGTNFPSGGALSVTETGFCLPSNFPVNAIVKWEAYE
ncbi:hypothetical protein [Cytobacillus firmus]|uniref:hypothetical protein n=1 Tax=Cytobacillus firmus TaxID=1399 RepID=UPI0018CFC863|nr:hypothetical protein [Cytobacillus firmus]MBG9585558.1 hypothetical protein [Cytobacillus firmus]MBG9585617.1 hypothetical protein [Cytobacillus firmus]MBG9586922.1 hypothetical protein [Cytobacillus firmus]MBG9587416.1 hypothetical protein [Cytobacillus firmus]